MSATRGNDPPRKEGKACRGTSRQRILVRWDKGRKGDSKRFIVKIWEDESFLQNEKREMMESTALMSIEGEAAEVVEKSEASLIERDGIEEGEVM